MQCQGPNCTREIEQPPGSHRQRIYCSDRCRMAARRLRLRGAEQTQIQQAEARARKERERMARRFGLLTEDSLDLLVELGHRDAKLARLVGQALANQKRAEQERSMQAAKARRLGAELGYPAVDALDLEEGEDRWRTYLANPKHPLEPLFAEIARLAERIKTVKVELYLRVENNSKFVRGKGKVRDEIERYILRQYDMEKHPNGVDYTLTIPYETEEQLERIIYQDILQEAASTADARYCFIEAQESILEVYSRGDAYLLGRTTYEMLWPFWSTQTDDEGSGRILNRMHKYVVSATLKTAPWKDSTIITGNVVEAITTLKQQPGKDIILDGSASLVHSLMGTDLIDEFRFLVQPIVMGRGRRFFPDGMPPTKLKLVESQKLPFGVLALTYQPDKQ